MSITVAGVLAYGYDLGGPEEWFVREVDETGTISVPWYNEEDEDFSSKADGLIRAAHGFTETAYEVDGYYDRLFAAQRAAGVEVHGYGTGYTESYLLASYRTSVYGGGVEEVDLMALEQRRLTEDWDSKLAAALVVLGLTPLSGHPSWLLASYYSG